MVPADVPRLGYARAAPAGATAGGSGQGAPVDARAGHPAAVPARQVGTRAVRPRRRRGPGPGLALLVAAVALAGCGLVAGLVRTQSKLEHAGYGNATVTFSTTGARTTVRVTADRSATAGTGLAAQARGVATVVWRTLPGSFQRLAVTVRGAGTVTYDDARLRQLFGPRPASLDQQSLSGAAAHDGALAVAGLLLVLVVLALVVVVLAVSLRRRRRRDRAARTALLMSTIPEHLWEHADPRLGGGAGGGSGSGSGRQP